VHKQRIAVLITAAIGMGASFLPWCYFFGPVYGYSGDYVDSLGFHVPFLESWGCFVPFGLLLILSLFVGDRRQAMRGWMLWAVVAGGILAFLYAFLRFNQYLDGGSAFPDSLTPAWAAHRFTNGNFDAGVLSLALIVLAVALKGRRPSGKPES
jgi:hypothetical protein